MTRVRIRELLLSAAVLSAAAVNAGVDQPSVRVDVTRVGPRPLEEQTQASVVRDYLDAWRTFGQALAENRTDLLNRSFVGLASQQLSDTVVQQRKAGIETQYRDLSHDLVFVFYSPEGMSIQLIDNVNYEVQLLQQGRVRGVEHVHAKYIAVLSPTETRWKVRVLQAAPE